MEVKNAGHEDNDVLVHLMQVYLGTVETSSFVETMFSTARQVWNEAHTNLGATPFECETILKKGKVLVRRYVEYYCRERSRGIAVLLRTNQLHVPNIPNNNWLVNWVN